jgi:hypothetical protein
MGYTKNNIVLFGDCKMAKPKVNRGAKVSTVDITDNICKDCGAKHQAIKTTWTNGDIVVSPPRCKPCQTAHLTNLRVNHTIKDIQLLGNLKARLSPEQREAVATVIGNELQVLLDRYAGTAMSAMKFDLKKVEIAD